MDARTYDPRIGRFIQPDLYNFSNLALPRSSQHVLLLLLDLNSADLLTDPAQQVKYSYTKGNPLSKIDLTGLAEAVGYGFSFSAFGVGGSADIEFAWDKSGNWDIQVTSGLGTSTSTTGWLWTSDRTLSSDKVIVDDRLGTGVETTLSGNAIIAMSTSANISSTEVVENTTSYGIGTPRLGKSVIPTTTRRKEKKCPVHL